MARQMEVLDPYDNDPLLAFQKRDPIAENASVSVFALAERGSEERVFQAAEALKGLLIERNRSARILPATVDQDGWGSAVERCLQDVKEPVVIISTATEAWTAGQLDPLLKAISRADHVVGSRRSSFWSRLIRSWKSRTWRIIFAAPWKDVHSPCRIHRREKLEELIFQSRSSFLEIEIAAKATFLGHLLDEVEIDDLAGQPSKRHLADIARVFQNPLFRGSDSTPFEKTQSQQEGSDSPNGQDRQGLENDLIEKPRPFEQDRS